VLVRNQARACSIIEMYILVAVTLLAVLASFIADRKKTYQGLQRGWKMFISLLPALLTILILVSAVLYIIPQAVLVRWLGRDSGIAGITIAAAVGSIALIPGFIAFPLAAVLLKSGVGYSVLAVFLTTLMMVGIITLPLESKYFGMKAALLRNGLSFLGALVIGVLVGMLM
jgi:uncharacterized membrane protein YraQ (UPF0718 family)